MTRETFLQRQDKLLTQIRNAKVDALLVCGVANVSYLTGFSGDSSYLLIGPNVRVLISDSRYQTQIAEECPGLEADIRTQKTKLHDQIAEVIARAKPAKLAFESHILSAEDAAKLRERIEQTEHGKSIVIQPLASTVETLRQIKDADEIAETRTAIRIAEQAFRHLKGALTNKPLENSPIPLPASPTELQIAHWLEHTMRWLGADRAAFDPIIAAGDRAALPHYRPSHRRISEAPFLLVDWGAATSRGYRSDLTRVIATGPVPSKLRELHEIVLRAQAAGIAMIRPGAKLRDVDAAARRVIEEAGYSDFFGHGLGHGIGLHIHEEPRMSSIADGELQVGNIVTVEPGIYLPNVAGVRIEDDVLVTPDGHEVLSDLSKALED